MRVVTLALIAVSAVLMIITTVRYHRLMRYNRQETYRSQKSGRSLDILCLILLYVFIFGFIVGAADVIQRDVEPIYYFIVAIFFFGTCFVFIVISAQKTMALNLRVKTLEVMNTFVKAIDMKDVYAASHSQDVYKIVEAFYEALHESFKKRLNQPKLLDAALLHDIGKIHIKEELLNKEETLSAEDWVIIKAHPRIGKEMLDQASFFEISDWVLYHHERLDGKGYYGLPGAQIPLESRIIAIADAYAALCSDRIYRTKRTHEEAVRIMVEATGSQFDPELMENFLKLKKEELHDLLGESKP